MSEPINDGGAAFPCHGISGQVFQYGMTLRDWFAGQALAGMIAGSGDSYGGVDYDEPDVAKNIWKMADAMIAAREGRAE